MKGWRKGGEKVEGLVRWLDEGFMSVLAIFLKREF